MRNEETWLHKARPKIIKEFTPRMIKDLETISTPTDLPKLESMFIHGPVKSGKTIWSIFLMLEACKQRYLNGTNETIEFIKTAEMFNDIKRCYDDASRNEQEYLDRLSETDFLVLDDFGAERPTDWVLSLLYLLVDRRYENMKTTIYTSNHDLKEISKRLGDLRITSRIERSCKIIKKVTKY
jgi:DNA replication protein DnaC